MRRAVTPVDRHTRLLLAVFRVGVALLFTILAISFWNLQVGQHARFLQMAENNHQRTLSLRAPRGVVFDRGGRVLVENRYSLNISLVRELVEGSRSVAPATGSRDRHQRGDRPRNR